MQPDVHCPFRFRNLDDLRAAARELGLDIPADEDTSPLIRPVTLSGFDVPNAMCCQPMEGCDSEPSGAPGELTFRRYRRFAEGGAGMIWFEACAVVEEGRANPHQLWLTRQNRDEFARLLDESLRAAGRTRPLTMLQLTHSGRYSRPHAGPEPVIAHHDPILDKAQGIPPDHPLIGDDDLERLEDAYAESAALAFEIGFDAVDVKSCHRYLVNELLAAHTRPGRYGGTYENRTRFLKNVIGKVRSRVGEGRMITCRLNVFDAHPYPHGWGMDPDDPIAYDLDEPIRLIRELGLPMVNVTMGNPYFNPHINRPLDKPVEGAKLPAENPMIGIARLIGLTAQVQRAVPDVAIVGSGYSWLRHLWPHVAAAQLRLGGATLIGLGRQAFAYPAFAREIIETGRLAPDHTCVTCSSCTQIMRDGGMAGCVPFDGEIYGPIYRQGRSIAAAE